MSDHDGHTINVGPVTIGEVMTGDDLRALSAAATPGPWEDGDVWSWAGCGFNGNGPDECVLCSRMGEPVWTGKADINGKWMHAHKHRNPDPYGAGHRISGPGGTVAGNYDYEEGGIIDVEDLRLIVWLRNHADALADLIDAAKAVMVGTWGELSGDTATSQTWHDLRDALTALADDA